MINEEIESFAGNSEISAKIAGETLKKLKYDKDDIKIIVNLIQHLNIRLEADTIFVKKLLSVLGKKKLQNLLKVKHYCIMAQSQASKDTNLPILEKIPPIINQIKTQRQCYSMSQLALKHTDLQKMGFKRKKINKAVLYLLNLVIKEKIKNTKEELIKTIQTDPVLLEMSRLV
jgi:tRNA nucleotidyltransferase (CCA-adding enzyme)